MIATSVNPVKIAFKTIREMSAWHASLYFFGNKEVDEIIKNPIYIPPNDQDEVSIEYNGRLNYYEWIPWEDSSNIKEIARGGFGIIYKATWVDGNIRTGNLKYHASTEYERWGEQKVAIKIIKMTSTEVFKELNVHRAMAIESSLYNVSSILGITQNAETLEYGIVMEFAEHGDMRKYLSTNFHSTSLKDKLWIAWRIAAGLSQIHSSDLGLCQPINHETTKTTTDPTIRKAISEKKIYEVIPYIPPEVLRGEKFTMAGDIYSFALLLWELATGMPPFHDREHDHFLIMDILNGKRHNIISPLIPPSIAELIENC
ncbi:hypothetical protein G9A89_016835 [Geosiphon pyriformis]|nr:hypothetical protein G9A89_016835 [Geosiphon pyriformis]